MLRRRVDRVQDLLCLTYVRVWKGTENYYIWLEIVGFGYIDNYNPLKVAKV